MSRDRTDEALAQLAELHGTSAPEPGAELLASLGQLRPVPPRRPVRAVVRVALVSLAYGALLVPGIGLRRDMGELPRWFLLGFGVTWLAVFVLGLAAGLLPRRRQVAPDVGRLRVVLVPAVLALCVGALLLAQRGPSSGDSTGSLLSFARHGLPCLALGLLVALVPVFLAARALRHAVPAGSAWVAAALGAAGGALGTLVLHMHCAVADGPHVGLIHGGSMAVAALLSAWRVSAMLRP